MSSTWTAVTITAPRALADAIESFLFDHGAPGLQIEDVVEGTRITAHFPARPPLDVLRGFLAVLGEQVSDAGAATVELETIADNHWAENWKDHFPPLTIGRRLFVRPPWVAPAPDGRIDIVIDPGMAFGTGHHASTRGCLVELERVLESLPNARTLDLGTGSGILAIAAAKLGAAAISAIDIDPDARAITAQNAARNGVAERIHIDSGLDVARGPFEIVVANLLAGALIELAAEIAQRLVPGGIVIGAGVLAEEALAVRAAWRAAGLADDGDWSDEGWAALVARRAR